MKTELEAKDISANLKEFQNLLDQDFEDRNLKENEITSAVVTEITKNYVIVDCKAVMTLLSELQEFLFASHPHE